MMYGVALRKESVDRNIFITLRCLLVSASLSARRAWIEIGVLGWSPVGQTSLSARRAWIEIARPTKEIPDQYRRSPQGERG